MGKRKLQHGDSQSRTNASNKTTRHIVGGNIPKRRGRPPTKNNKATTSIKISSINQKPIQHDSQVENRTPGPLNQSISNNQTNSVINNDESILLQLAQVRQKIELQQIEHEQMMKIL